MFIIFSLVTYCTQKYIYFLLLQVMLKNFSYKVKTKNDSYSTTRKDSQRTQQHFLERYPQSESFICGKCVKPSHVVCDSHRISTCIELSFTLYLLCWFIFFNIYLVNFVTSYTCCFSEIVNNFL